MSNTFIIIMEIIIFSCYVLVCSSLFKRRYSLRTSLIVFIGVLLAVVAGNAAIVLSDGSSLMLTLAPLTAYFPYTAALFFLSSGGVFENAAISFIGLLEVLILESLAKCLEQLNFQMGGLAVELVKNGIVVLAAAALVFITFKRLRGLFRLYIAEADKKRDLILMVPVLVILLALFYFLGSTIDVFILILTILAALSVFLIIARLLNTTANLSNAKRSEKELFEYIDIQRRGYERVVQKMETTREFRHDMRHHLAVIEGLAKNGENDKIVEYTSNLNGSFGKSENINYCMNSALNALLSEYIGRAENAGCKITQSFMLPSNLPFEESDVCLVLANVIDNAINACKKLPREERYIKLSAGYTDTHKLLIAVENPCAETVEFGENGLPISSTEKGLEEHGIGLRSVKRVVEKYNGFLRCTQENGKFILHTALFYDSAGAALKARKAPKKVSRAAVTVCSLFLGVIVVLNISPTVADAASQLLSINIRTVRDIFLRWGSSSIDVQRPEFGGTGSDKLNSATTSCIDEAKEKFMWYFNRRYEGYVGEDMKYTVIRDDERYLIVRFEVTVNAGSSIDYNRWINYDKTAGKVLELSDLFKEGSDYVSVLSAEILEQMRFFNEHSDGMHYFIDGEDAFTEIEPDANFYIDGFGRIVIVFDESEVASGALGCPEFIIPEKTLERIER